MRGGAAAPPGGRAAHQAELLSRDKRSGSAWAAPRFGAKLRSSPSGEEAESNQAFIGHVVLPTTPK